MVLQGVPNSLKSPRRPPGALIDALSQFISGSFPVRLRYCSCFAPLNDVEKEEVRVKRVMRVKPAQTGTFRRIPVNLDLQKHFGVSEETMRCRRASSSGLQAVAASLFAAISAYSSLFSIPRA